MISDSRRHPPRAFDKLLEWYCDERYLEEVQGALYEYYHDMHEKGQVRRAGWLFAINVMAHCRPYLWKKSKSRKLNFMLTNHLKISFRNLWKYKLNTALNTFGLTLGVTVFLLIALWIRHEQSYDAFHSKADRIYRISNTFTSETEQFSQAPSGPALGKRLPETFPNIEAGVRVGQSSAQIEIEGRTFFENNIFIVDPSFFDVFDFNVLKGNTSDPFDPLNSVVITASTAKKYFGDEDPIGKRIVADGEDHMIVSAVVEDAPANSQLQYSMLISMDLLKEMYGMPNMDDNWGGGWFHTYLLLQPGTDVDQLKEEINAHILPKLEWFTERNMSYEYFLQPMASIHLHSALRYDFASNGSARNVFIFTAVAIIILLLACINYVNLSTASAINRAKEVGIKKVIGAPRRVLFFQHLTETMIVLFGAAGIALGLVFLLVPYFEDFLGYQLALPSQIQIILPAMGVAVVLGFLTGALPATVISAYRPLSVLKGAMKSGKSGRLLRRVLVVMQFTASIALILAIITVHQQMKHIVNKDLGMQVDEVLHISFRGVESVSERGDVLINGLKEHPAIKSVSFQSRGYPVNGLSNGMVMVEKEDGSRVSSSLYHMWVDEEFASTFGIEMVTGRFFSKEFPADSTRSVIVNESAVRDFGWASAEDALGKEMGDPPNARKVIGVVRDFHFEGLQKRIEPVRILPIHDRHPGTLAIRADLQDPMEVLTHVEKVWQAVVPEVALDIRFMNDDIRRQYETEWMFRSLFLLLSTISIVIACLGLFGLASSSVAQRIKEVGIRKVLGASQMSLLRLLNKEFLILVSISLAVATPVAWLAMERWLENFQYRIGFEWYFVVIAGSLTLGLALLTASSKAYWASRTNPSNVLRSE